MRHPNVEAFQNSIHARSKSLGEQLSQMEILLGKLAKHYSVEGWAEMLELSAKEAHELWHPAKAKTLVEEYGLSLLPARERAESAASIGRG